MRIKQAFQLAIKSLTASKLRSVLTMLGIIIGVAAVIVIVSLITGMTKDMLASFESMGSTTITVSIKGRGGNRAVSIDDMQNLVLDNPSVLSAMTPTITVANAVAKNGNTNMNPSRVIGVNEAYSDIKNLNIESGRSLTYIDCESRLKNCAIGTYVANELFGTSNVVGNTIKINGVNFNIIGVFEETDENQQGGADDFVIIPYTVAAKLAYNFTISSYTFDATSEATSADAQRVIEGYLLKVFTSSDYYTVQNMSSMIDTISDLTNKMSMVGAGVAGVSLLVGGIGIMNIMLVSVTERTREIGIRKSLGATPWDIMSQFVVEAITTSCIGGIFGIVLGVGLSYLATLFKLKIALSLPAILISFTISGAIGVAFGYFPAKKAARLNPIDALRFD